MVLKGARWFPDVWGALTFTRNTIKPQSYGFFRVPRFPFDPIVPPPFPVMDYRAKLAIWGKASQVQMGLVEEHRLHWPRGELRYDCNKSNSWTGCPPVWLQPGWYSVSFFEIMLKITQWTSRNWSNDDLWEDCCCFFFLVELHLKLELRESVILSVMIVAIIRPWPDSRHSKLPSSPRCCLCSSLIWLRVPTSLEKYPQLRRIYYWSPLPTGVIYLHPHTHSVSILPTRCVAQIYWEYYDRTDRLPEKSFSQRDYSGGADLSFSGERNTSI